VALTATAPDDFGAANDSPAVATASGPTSAIAIASLEALILIGLSCVSSCRRSLWEDATVGFTQVGPKARRLYPPSIAQRVEPNSAMQNAEDRRRVRIVRPRQISQDGLMDNKSRSREEQVLLQSSLGTLQIRPTADEPRDEGDLVETGERKGQSAPQIK
jgi:hypothetical protein